MFGKTIRSEVLARVNTLIDVKEKEYKEGKRVIADQALAQMEAVTREADAKKAELRDKCVSDLLSKIV